MDIREKLKQLPAKIRNIPRAIKEAIIGYRESYRKGVEKFGVWWTVFQISIWGFILIFIVTAVIIFVLYLPKIERIDLEKEVKAYEKYVLEVLIKA